MLWHGIYRTFYAVLGSFVQHIAYLPMASLHKLQVKIFSKVYGSHWNNTERFIEVVRENLGAGVGEVFDSTPSKLNKIALVENMNPYIDRRVRSCMYVPP